MDRTTLGLTTEDINIALQRLLRLDLLEMSDRDHWIDKSGDAEFHSAGLTEASLNQMQQEVHELAVAAIQRIPSRCRIHRQVAVALDSKQLPRFTMLAAEFMHEIQTLISESDTKDDVYQIEISIFPVTTIKKFKGEKNG